MLNQTRSISLSPKAVSPVELGTCGNGCKHSGDTLLRTVPTVPQLDSTDLSHGEPFIIIIKKIIFIENHSIFQTFLSILF